MLVSGWKWKTRKIIIPSPIPSYEALVSVKENTDKKRKKKQERKKERKRKIPIEHKPHWTLLMLCIISKYYPNN